MIRKDKKENMIPLTYENASITIKELEKKNIKITNLLTKRKLYQRDYNLEDFDEKTKEIYGKEFTTYALTAYANIDDVINLHKKNLKNYEKPKKVKSLTNEEVKFYDANH